MFVKTVSRHILGFPKFVLTELANLANLPNTVTLNHTCSTIGTSH